MHVCLYGYIYKIPAHSEAPIGVLRPLKSNRLNGNWPLVTMSFNDSGFCDLQMSKSRDLLSSFVIVSDIVWLCPHPKYLEF